MPKNIIQFQKGIGLHEFLEKYGTKAQCSQAPVSCAVDMGETCIRHLMCLRVSESRTCCRKWRATPTPAAHDPPGPIGCR
jgi:hypothetical protein